MLPPFVRDGLGEVTRLSPSDAARPQSNRTLVNAPDGQTARAERVAASECRRRKMANTFIGDDADGELEVRPGGGAGHAVEMLVDTPSKLLEMARGNGWNKKFDEDWPEVSLSDVEWVVDEEADVFSVRIYAYISSSGAVLMYGIDPGFIDQTLLLLSDVAAARGKLVHVISRAEPAFKSPASPPTPLDNLFNLILTSATIPAVLALHLYAHHPRATRLVSPRPHRLPARLALEFAPYTSGNRNAEDEQAAASASSYSSTRTRAGEMGGYLSQHGVPNVVVTGQGGIGGKQVSAGAGTEVEVEVGPESQRVLLSTSLLSRGLDFDPSVSHVFVLEPPRNTADFSFCIVRGARRGREGVGGWWARFGESPRDASADLRAEAEDSSLKTTESQSSCFHLFSVTWSLRNYIKITTFTLLSYRL
ncbi:hypothetical protein V8E53_008298 [Lactarius tabidus]